MKFFAAALLAVAASAVKIQDAFVKPFPDPTCPAKPTKAEQDAAKANPELVFNKVDADGSGKISPQEGYNALYCAVDWGFITKDQAITAGKYLLKVAGDDKLLSKDEAKKALEAYKASQ